MDAAKAMSIKTAADAMKMSELTKKMSIDNKKKNGYLMELYVPVDTIQPNLASAQFISANAMTNNIFGI